MSTNNQTLDIPKSHLVRLASADINYWISFASDPLTVVFLVLWEAFGLHSSLLSLSISFGSGLLGWTLLEYVFHRWVYHKGETPAHIGHRIHHESPRTLIAMPWFIVTPFFGGLWYLFAYRLQFHSFSTSMAGLLTGFVVYGAFHHIHHHYNFKGGWYRRLKTHHIIHHQFPHVNFGVTSRLWDHVFGTTYRKETRKTPPAPSEKAFDY